MKIELSEIIKLIKSMHKKYFSEWTNDEALSALEYNAVLLDVIKKINDTYKLK